MCVFAKFGKPVYAVAASGDGRSAPIIFLYNMTIYIYIINNNISYCNVYYTVYAVAAFGRHRQYNIYIL